MQPPVARAVRSRPRSEADLVPLRQISERIADGLWMTTGDFRRVLYVSPGVERIWGIPAETLLRQPRAGYAAVHDEDQGALATALATVRERDVEICFRVRQADGAIKWVRTRAFAVTDGRRRARRIAGIVEDVTERQQALALVRSSRWHLANAGRSLATLGALIGVDGAVGTGSDGGGAEPDSRVLAILAANEPFADRLSALTERERQIAMHMLAGVPTKRIATELKLRPKTVEQHRSAVLRKMGATSTSSLVRQAMGIR